MKNIFVFLLAFIFCGSVNAQNEVMTEFGETITQDELVELLTIVASDALEGRETGKRGQKMAAAFIADNFKSMGLEAVVPTADGKSYFQKFILENSKPGNIYMLSEGEKYANGENVLYYGKHNSNGEVTVETVFVGDGSNEAFANVDVKGKAVVIDGNGQSFAIWREKMAMAYKNGAAMLIIIPAADDEQSMAWIQRYSAYFMRGSLGFKPEKQENPAKGLFLVTPGIAAQLLNSSASTMSKATVQAAAGNFNQLQKIKSAKITYATEMDIKEVETENVLGYLEGSDKKDELVIITAHYDHIGRNGEQINNGADDDGSGTTSVMEIAEAFVEAKKAGHGPRRSMLFMTVTGEEKGLLGSEYYTKNPVFPLENTVVDLNIDMVGRTDEAHADDREFVYLVGSDRLSSELHDLSEEVNKTFTNLSLDYTYNDEDHKDRIYYRSDHWNFAKNNIPIIFYFNGTHDDYHRPSDTVDKIEFDLLQKRAQLVFYTAWVVANRDDRLVVDKLEDQQLTESH